MSRWLSILFFIASLGLSLAYGEDAAKDSDLLNVVLAQSETLKNSTLQLEVGGNARARFISANKDMLNLDIGGQQQPIPWKLVGVNDIFLMAQIGATTVDELLTVARYAHAHDLHAIAEKALDKALDRALQQESSRAKEIELLYTQIKGAPKAAATAAASGSASAVSHAAVPAGPWQCLGPGGGGTIYNPAVCGSDPKTLIVTCDMGGVYLTRDGGRHWRVLPGLKYGSGVAYGADANTIFVGCSDMVHRSLDGGLTWTGVTADRKYPLCSGHDVLVDADDPRCVWVSFGRGGEAGFKDYGSDRLTIERSMDGGGAFKDASQGLPQEAGLVKRLAIDRSTPVGNRTLYAATSSGFFRSRDGGGSWEKAGGGLPRQDLRDCVTLFDKGARKTSIVVALEPPGGVYRSEDGGATFTPSGRGLSDKDDGSGFIVEELAAGWSDPSMLYAGGTSCCASNDGGHTWRKVYADANKEAGWLMTFFPWAHDGVRSVGCNPKNPKQVWFSGDMQLFYSEDGGATLLEANSHPMPEGVPRFAFKEQHHKVPTKAPFYFDGGGLEVTFVYQVIPDRQRPGLLYACYADMGSFRTEDAGKSWTYNEGIWNSGIKSEWRNSCYEIAIDRRAPDHLFGVFSGCHNLPQAANPEGRYGIGGVAESADGGKSWTPFESNGVPDRPCTSVLIDRRSGALYVAAYGTGVFRSTNGGKSFEAISAGLPHNPFVWRLRQTPDNTIYLACACGQPGGIWKFDDGKSSWSRIDKSPALTDVRDLRVMEGGGKDNDKFLAAAAEGADGGVYASNDGGETWKKLFATPVHSVDRSPDGRIWVAGGQGGVYHSLDGGATWARMNDFPFVNGANDTTLNPKNPGEVWVGTNGCGVFRGSSQ